MAIVNGFIDQRLDDPCVAFTFSGGPEFSTRVVALTNGREKRNASWSLPKHTYTAPFMNITPEAFEAIKGVFYVAHGRLYAFRFKDWTDYEADGTIMGLSVAGSAPVQLTKRYTFGAEVYQRPITKPIASTVQVFADGVAKPGTVDDLTGLFTPTTPFVDGSVLTWSGEFDVPVRFDTDSIPFTYDNLQALNGEVALVEVFA
jgi:uncharacterized protein (TIGR02217 family)